jgi:acyl transferase domain-containing protein
VNSFGYGGSNTHIVLDDAYNYLRLRHLRGNHCTIPFPRDESLHVSAVNETSNSSIQVISPKDARPILLVWSAADRNGINRIIEVYRNWYQKDFSSQRSDDVLEDLAFTLNLHRSHLQWRSFAVLRSIDGLNDLQFSMSIPLRMRPNVLRIGFIFNGQGSQWPGMGRELICYASFRKDINHAENSLRTLGCTWSLMGKAPY